jgi:hypothetical protein
VKRTEKQTRYYRSVPDFGRKVAAPPVYPDTGFTMWTPTYVPVDGGFVPLVDASYEVEVEVEYLSVGELRDAIKDLPAEALVRYLDQEYDYQRDARSVRTTRDGALLIE